MARKDDDLESILDELKSEISTSMLAGSINNVVKEVYKKNIDKMYDSYEPTYYMRRGYNGGFGDENNWETSVSDSKDSLELELTNEAKPMYDTQHRLDTIIEEGMYDYNTNPGKREVYQWTQDEIDSSNIIEKALEEDLKEWF